ncbi:zinc finger, C2H2 type [Dictyocaulus viviparus]|uniref:Zinc finger, C2H2 type n=1 Tax=Dictyocaulus viviparus TaxID=29172 RepID=A0A0D8Y3F4_DICVI|nr:zinc finger, C2H2 type [Dictyocaulus viviparus]
MDRLSPISTDSGFESCCCPSSPATSLSVLKYNRPSFVSSLPSSSTSSTSVGDTQNVLCDLIPSGSDASLYREDSVSLDSLSTASNNNKCSSCATCSSCDSSHSKSFEGTFTKPPCVDIGTIRYHCLWNGCQNVYDKADNLYDHVIEMHIDVLRGLTFNSSKTKQENEDDESIKCMWDDCTMFLKRGDQEKKISWLMDHYRTRHARAANPFHCVIEGCKMRFSTTYRLEEHVRLEHINPPKPMLRLAKETPVVLKKDSCYGWRPRLYYPVRPRPTVYCPHFDEQILKCVRFMSKHSFDVAFEPVDVYVDLKGAKRRKRKHRYLYRIVSSNSTVSKDLKPSLDVPHDVANIRNLSIFDLFPSVQSQVATFDVPVAKNET